MLSSRKISIKSPLPADKLLIRKARITEELGRPYTIHLECLSPDERLDLNALLGQELRIDVALDDGGHRYFHGYIAEVAQCGRLRTHVRYRLRVVPWLWLLTRSSDCRIFQDKSVPQIIEEVFRNHQELFPHARSKFVAILTKHYRPREYTVQYRETNYSFVIRLMEEAGIYFYFTHAEDGHTLVLADSYSSHHHIANYKTIDYFPPSDRTTRERDHIHEWRLARSIRSGKVVLKDYDFTKPNVNLRTQYVQHRDHANSDGEMFDYPGGYSTFDDGDHYARIQLEAIQTRHEYCRGKSNARGLATGALFTLARYPRADQNREYLVIKAHYALDAGEYETSRQSTAKDFLCKFEALDAKIPFRMRISTRKPTIHGPQTATVVGPEREEIYTDQYGRVKVQFHWDRYGENNETSSCWVRVSQIWAGKNWGWMSLPRIGQEVIVDYLEGDIDQPIITGRVYNQANMPPYDLPANKTQSGIKSRSTPRGTSENFNEIRFEDKKDGEQLYVHAERNMDSVVENDETTYVGHDRSERVENNESVSIGGFHTETVEMAKAETIYLAKALTIGAAYQITVGDIMNTTVALDQSEQVGLSKNVLVGKKFSIVAGEELRIMVGASCLVMRSDGTVQINGKNLNFSASGPVEINGREVDINPEKSTPALQTAAAEALRPIEVQTETGLITPPIEIETESGLFTPPIEVETEPGLFTTFRHKTAYGDYLKLKAGEPVENLGPCPTDPEKRAEWMERTFARMPITARSTQIASEEEVRREYLEKQAKEHAKYVNEQLGRLAGATAALGTAAGLLRESKGKHDSAVSGMSDRLRGMAPDQLRGMTPDQLRGMTPDQLRGMTPDQLRGMTPDQLRGMTPDQLRGMTPDQLRGSMPSSFGDGVPNPMSGSTPASFAGGTSNPMSGATPSSFAGGTSNPMSGAAPSSFAGGTSNPMSGATPSSFAGGTSNPMSGAAPSSFAGETSNPMSGATPSSLAGGTSNPMSGSTPSSFAGGTSNPMSGSTPSSFAGGTSNPMGGSTPSSFAGGTSNPMSGSTPSSFAGGTSNPMGGATPASFGDGMSNPMGGATPASFGDGMSNPMGGSTPASFGDGMSNPMSGSMPASFGDGMSNPMSGSMPSQSKEALIGSMPIEAHSETLETYENYEESIERSTRVPQSTTTATSATGGMSPESKWKQDNAPAGMPTSFDSGMSNPMSGARPDQLRSMTSGESPEQISNMLSSGGSAGGASESAPAIPAIPDELGIDDAMKEAATSPPAKIHEIADALETSHDPKRKLGIDQLAKPDGKIG